MSWPGLKCEECGCDSNFGHVRRVSLPFKSLEIVLSHFDVKAASHATCPECSKRIIDDFDKETEEKPLLRWVKRPPHNVVQAAWCLLIYEIKDIQKALYQGIKKDENGTDIS